MKIIFSNFDDSKNPHYGGGGAIAIHAVARRLAMHHSVLVLTGKYFRSTDEVIDGVKYCRIGFKSRSARFNQLSFAFALPFYVMTLQYDVWLESFTPPFSTSCLSLFTRKPVIGVTHLLGGREMQQRYRLPFTFVESMGLKAYEHIIVLTEYLKKSVLSANPKLNVKIITNGLNKKVISKTVNKAENYIAFLGRIDVHQKGLDVLLQAYAKIASKVNVALHIAGTGVESENRALKKLLSELNLTDKVKLVGRLNEEQKYEFLEKAYFAVIPSRLEGFAIVALEAMASECPLIISDIEGLTWIPDYVATRVKINDDNDLADKMSALLDNPTRRKEMSKNGKEFVKNYDWDNIASQYQDFIIEIVGKN